MADDLPAKFGGAGGSNAAADLIWQALQRGASSREVQKIAGFIAAMRS